MADTTDEQKKTEQKAADNQKKLADYNAKATKNQLGQQIENYDSANKQNKYLSDVQKTQNSRQSESERFNAMRDLQSSALGLMGSMNQAMNGSSIGNLMRMLDNRNDRDNETYWTQLQTNQNAVQNAYDEAANQNQVAKNDAIINAEKALSDMQSDLSANLSNINPDLFTVPGQGDADLGAKNYYNDNKVGTNYAELSGYIMPDNSVQAARDISGRNRLQGNDYFSRMMNRFNRRY